MKNRLKQLAKKAGFSLWGEETWNPGDVIDWGSRYDKELEKFTELIVQECVTVCLSERDPPALNYKPSERFATAIKNHFGVK